MKKVFKKWLAVCLTAILFVLFACPAFAATIEEPPIYPEGTFHGFTVEQLVEAVNTHDGATIKAFVESYVTEEENPFDPDQPTITPYWQSGWQGNDETKMAHSQLMSLGLLIYMADMSTLYQIPFTQIGYNTADFDILMEAVKKPDKPFSGTMSACADHFYDPDTGLNWSKTGDTAKDRFEEYYNRAISKYDTNRADAIEDLGWALHYIQDVNEPHHAANLIAGLSTHGPFEAYASTQLEYVYNNAAPMGDTELYEMARSMTPAAFLHQGAVQGKMLSEAANREAKTQAEKDALWQLPARFTLLGATYYTAATMYKFAKDVGMI